MHTIFFAVRDYECDLQGIVNNAVYQNYFEHARHEFLKEFEVSFSQAIKKGIYLLVAEINLKFKKSLQAQDEFKVCTEFVRLSTLKFGCQQKIYHLPTKKLYTEAKSIIVAINKEKRLIVYNLLDAIAPLNC